MTDAGDKIIKILEQIENEHNLPKGILKEIYNEELTQVHRDVRTNYVEKPLRELIVKHFEKYK
jgi:hypothetical protein